MVRKFLTIYAFIYETKKYNYLWRQSTISEQISQKLSDPIDFQPKFLDFWLIFGWLDLL